MERCHVGGYGGGRGESYELDDLFGCANKRLIIVGAFMLFALL